MLAVVGRIGDQPVAGVEPGHVRAGEGFAADLGADNEIGHGLLHIADLVFQTAAARQIVVLVVAHIRHDAGGRVEAAVQPAQVQQRGIAAGIDDLREFCLRGILIRLQQIAGVDRSAVHPEQGKRRVGAEQQDGEPAQGLQPSRQPGQRLPAEQIGQEDGDGQRIVEIVLAAREEEGIHQQEQQHGIQVAVPAARTAAERTDQQAAVDAPEQADVALAQLRRVDEDVLPGDRKETPEAVRQP